MLSYSLSLSYLLIDPAMTKAIPLYASANNALVTSSPISAKGEAITLGTWRIINQTKSLFPEGQQLTGLDL